MDTFKMNTMYDYTRYDINSKWVCPNKTEKTDKAQSSP